MFNDIHGIMYLIFRKEMMQLANIKIERINHLYQEEISKIIMTEIKDQAIKFVVITDVDTTNDLSFSKVYYRILNETDEKKTQEALEKAASFIRMKLAERVEIRHTPELKFIYDTSIDYGDHIETIIEKIHNN